ncbi:MAG: DUF1016 N-terminal domain-containing protein, partial [Bacteroidota bacterium]|nr:DUF1016 N-terminal domain-containing protein [Bacteroidota bacterium]
WLIGKMIVEEKQNGKGKAKYGKHLIMQLSLRLTKEFDKGYSLQHLKFCRQFYYLYPIGYALRSQHLTSISEAIISKNHPLYQMISPQLTWIHYRVLLKDSMVLEFLQLKNEIEQTKLNFDLN